MLNGLDISNNQGEVPDQVFQSQDFIIAKVTQDATFVDRFYQGYKRQARAAGCVFGGYHFAVIDKAPSPEDSCEFFLAHLDDEPGDIAALDIEETPDHDNPEIIWNAQPDQLNWILRWGQHFIARKNYIPKLYVGSYHINTHNLDHPEIAATFDLWYPYWPFSDTPDLPPAAPSPWDSYKLWQYSSKGLYDRNVYFGTREDLISTGAPNTQAPQPSPAPSPAPDIDYEALYWTPIMQLVEDMVKSGKHADLAFHATVSNAITLHKIAHGVEPVS